MVAAWWKQALAFRRGRENTSAVVERTGGGEEAVPWVVAYVARNALEAEIVRGRLANEDIPVALRGEAIASVYGLTHGPLAEVEVLVPEPLLARAQQLLASADEESDE